MAAMEPIAGEPLVSVILPTHDRAGLLPHSIGSVLAQSFTRFELVLVDDGSSEDIAAVAAQLADPRIRYLRRARGGVAAARNTGVAAARGRYLAFQDSDDEWLPGKLARQVEALEAAGPADHMVVSGLLRVRNGRARRYPGRGPGSGARLTHEDVLRQPFAYTQSWLVPRDALVAAGGFDETLRVWDDWELLIRLSARLKIRLLADALVISPVRGDGISRERDRFIHDMERILEKHAGPLGRQPAALAQLKYAQGRLLGSAGRSDDARGALVQALRLRPLHWRAAALLAASLVTGARGLQALLALVERGR